MSSYIAGRPASQSCLSLVSLSRSHERFTLQAFLRPIVSPFDCTFRHGMRDQTSRAPRRPTRSKPSIPGGPALFSPRRRDRTIRSRRGRESRQARTSCRPAKIRPSVDRRRPLREHRAGHPVERDRPPTGTRKAQKPISGRPRGLPGLSGPRQTTDATAGMGGSAAVETAV